MNLQSESNQARIFFGAIWAMEKRVSPGGPPDAGGPCGKEPKLCSGTTYSF